MGLVQISAILVQNYMHWEILNSNKPLMPGSPITAHAWNCGKVFGLHHKTHIKYFLCPKRLVGKK
jgi:hypothetical protein